MESSMAASFGYVSSMKGRDEPEIYPQEEIYLKATNVTLIDET